MRLILHACVLLIFAQSSCAQTFRSDTPYTPTFAREISQPKQISTHENQVAYPRNAAREGVEGISLVGLHMAADGSLIKNYLRKSAGSRDLDRAALKAASVVYVRPLLIDGVPVEGHLAIEYVWRLE